MDHLADKGNMGTGCICLCRSTYRNNIRVINENPWAICFAIICSCGLQKELENFTPDWHIIQAPEFKADPATDGTRQHNFAIVNFTKKVILIGGTGYTEK